MKDRHVLQYYRLFDRFVRICYTWLWICVGLVFIGSVITFCVNNPLPEDTSDDVVMIEPDIRSTVKSPAELLDKTCDRISSAVDRLTHEHALTVISVVEPTCNSRGYTIYACDCGKQYIANEVDMLNHTWGNWATTKPATTKEEGVKWRKCLYCAAGEYGVIPPTTKSEAKNYIGRWQIPAVNVDVGLYRQSANEGALLVDAVDSATFFYADSGCMVIGDHVEQGFWAIKSCEPGDTAVIRGEDGSERTFICDSVIQGHNTVDYLSDLDGNNLYEKYPGALFCYTCNETWTNVTIVIFYPS